MHYIALFFTTLNVNKKWHFETLIGGERKRGGRKIEINVTTQKNTLMKLKT